MFLLKKFLVAWAFPPAGLILLALVGIVLLFHHRRRLGLACILVAQGLLLALSLPLVASALIRSVERYPAIAPGALRQAQAIVVLGGGSHYAAAEYGGEDTVSAPSLQRVRYGAWLARQSRLPLAVTGGVVYRGRAEALSMGEVLQDEFHVPVRWVESEARNTKENALYTARLLKADGIQRIALVSHGYHLARAVPLFEAQGLQVLPAPTMLSAPVEGVEAWLPSAGGLDVSNRALMEWVGRALP